MADKLRATWGVRSAGDARGYGVVVGVEIGSEGQFITEADILGAVNGVFMFDVRMGDACEVLIRTGTPPPGIGDQFRIGETAGYVTDARFTESNTSYQKLRISTAAHYHVNRAQNAIS